MAASGAAADEAAGTGDDVTIAREVARYTREAAELLGAVTGEVSGWVARLWQSLTTSGGHLEGLGEAALALIGIIVATIVIFHLLRFFADRLFRWLARRARDAGWLEIAVLLVAGSLVDALVILLAWAGGYALALYGFDGSGQMHTNQSLYLNAFLLIESSKVVLRFFLAPRYGDLRLVRLPDLQANYWYFWLSRIIGLLGYGMLLVVPIVRFNLPREIGAATEYLIGAAALAMAIVVILQNRQGLRAGARREGPGARGRFHRPRPDAAGADLAPARHGLLRRAVRRLGRASAWSAAVHGERHRREHPRDRARDRRGRRDLTGDHRRAAPAGRGQAAPAPARGEAERLRAGDAAGRARPGAGRGGPDGRPGMGRVRRHVLGGERGRSGGGGTRVQRRHHPAGRGAALAGAVVLDRVPAQPATARASRARACARCSPCCATRRRW